MLRIIAMAAFVMAATAAPTLADDAQDCNNATALLQTDPARAVAACSKQGEQGDAHAAFMLGAMYQFGEGVPQDYKAAAGLYRQAAEQGLAAAQLNLGALYQSGDGVPQDYVQAYMWYTVAMAAFPPGVDHDRADRNRGQVAGRMPPAEISRAQALAAEWKPKAAE